jgi:hypothetical protein
MIDKITPRALDKSSDSKLVPKTSMVDALNIFITDDNVDGEGNVGVLKNIKGNKSVDYAQETDRPSDVSAQIKVIGSVTDSKTQICYFFVWSQEAKDHGVYAYDKRGKLPLSTTSAQGVANSIRKIFTSAQFNFPEHGFVKGDIVYTNTNELEKHTAIAEFLDSRKALKVDFEKDILLYFTDNENEPRKINAYRALLNGPSFTSFPSAYFLDRFAVTDFICACPKTPLDRITFAFSPDVSRSTNNFSASPGFQFAYQNIYKDGVESTISAYSAIAFPPSILNRGAAQKSNLLSHNLCELKIPSVGPEVEKIRILARYGNSANFFEVDEVSTTISTTLNWDLPSRTYKFYNDRVASGVSPLEVDKTFDNLPRKAQAQTAISNRLIYGNYLEGYDNVKTECTAEVVYNPRPQDYIDLLVKANPSIERSKYGDNKSVGFQIDTTEFPSSITAGTTINVIVEFSPDKNFHIYQAQDTQKTYHQSRQVGKNSFNAQGYPRWPIEQENNRWRANGEDIPPEGTNDTHELTHASDQEADGDPTQVHPDRWDTQDQAGQEYLMTYQDRFFGANFGVGTDLYYDNDGDVTGGITQLPLWKVTNNPNPNVSDEYLTQGGEGVEARYGTSAGNPLILNGKPLTFSVKLKITQDDQSNGKKIVGQTVAEALAGADGTTLQMGGGGLFTWADYVEVNPEDVQNVFTITKDEYDLGLGEGPGTYDFKKIAVGSPESSLICGVGNGGKNFQGFSSGGGGDERAEILLKPQNAIPFGYFIINRAKVDFYLEMVTEGGHENGTHLRLGISKIDVNEEDVMTCFKRLDPRSPWWAIAPSSIKNPEFQQKLSFPSSGEASTDHLVDFDDPDYLSSLHGQFDISDPVFYHTAAVPKWFTQGWHDLTFDYDVYMPTQHRTSYPNLGFCGYLNMTETELYKPLLTNPYDTHFIPRVGVNNFKFSIMDGEGGPGGKVAGGNSAYDNYENNKHGSIAARVDFGYDESSVVLSYSESSTIRIWQAWVGGTTEEDNGIGGVAGVGFMGTGSADIAEELGIGDDDAEGSAANGNTGGTTGLWRERYVLSGPFFTGSIAMNPVVGEESDAANPQVFPPHKDYTTTLPLIWTNGESQVIGAEPEEYIIDGKWKRNWLKRSYPWPQVVQNAPNIPYGENYPIDLLPFKNPRRYEDDAWADIGEDGEPVSGLISYGTLGQNSCPATSYFGSIDFSLKHSHIEGEARSAINISAESSMSFKSSATHEFGVVYYDERGRHGYVNHLDTVYVEGYSSQKRGDGNRQGPAHIKLKLNHNPPNWAHNYKIVYSKNTSVSDFIQYSSGGAFVAAGTSDEGDSSKIYVSLNYLQGHPISYSSAWGARSSDGSMVLYTPKDGDRLRVVSFMLPPSNEDVPDRSYPLNFDFEVAGVVSLDDSEDNPLAYWNSDVDSEIIVDENRQGLFLVIKNNSSANGFRYQDVRDGSHHWGDNCLMELYSPVKELDAEDRLYYEIGDTYRVLNDAPTTGGGFTGLSQGLYHETDEILLTEGDVYFRSAAVNFRDYDSPSYTDLIIKTEPDNPDPNNPTPDINEFLASESNFKSYYIESPSATDLFKSDGISVGRPHVIKHDAKEAYKEASLIHSDRDITEAGKVSYSSFNRSVPIDMDLDLKNGAINYLANHDENCIFIQKDKCGHVPIDRNIISDVSGESNLIASSKFLNTPRYYAGRAGADGNPESVVSIDNAAYFAHKSLGEVYKISGANGVNVISGNNMDSYFKEIFQQAIDKSTLNGADVRVVGGYDPLKDEFLITVLDPKTYGLTSSPVFPEQPDGTIDVYGCTDPDSANYNEFATVDDGSCPNPIYGCTNPNADNYDSTADADDGSCIISGCTDPDALGYDEDANDEDGSCIYAADLCNFQYLLNNVLFDSNNLPIGTEVDENGEVVEGFITQDSINFAFNLAQNDNWLAQNDLTATQVYPDLDGNGVIGSSDLLFLLELYDGTNTDWLCGASPDLMPEITAQWNNCNLSSGGSLFNNPPTDIWDYLELGEKIGPPDIEPMKLLVNFENLPFLTSTQTLKVIVQLQSTDDNVEYTELGDEFEGQTDFEAPTMFYIDPVGNDDINADLSFDGGIIVYEFEGADNNTDGLILGTTDCREINIYSPYNWETGEWLNGTELPEFSPPLNLYPKPAAQGYECESENSTRRNTIRIASFFTDTEDPTFSDNNTIISQEIESRVGWRMLGEDWITCASTGFMPSARSAVSLPFTGSLCDYPLLIDSNNQITLQSITDAKEYVDGQIAQGEMTTIEATNHFPNWPSHSVFGNYPVSGGDIITYFEENNGVNFQDMNQSFEMFPEFQAYTLHDYLPTYSYHNWLTGQNPNWPYINDNDASQGQIALQCSQPYTGDLCDYPLLVGNMHLMGSWASWSEATGDTPEFFMNTWLDTVAPGVGQTGFYSGIVWAYAQVQEMLQSGEISQAEATIMFPDLTGDGMIGVGDYTAALALTSTPVLCTDTLCFTGDLCDYPWLFDNVTGLLDPPYNGPWPEYHESYPEFFFNMIFNQDTNNQLSTFPQWQSLNESGFGTLIFPDFNCDGVISTSDWLEMLNYIALDPPYICPDIGKPGQAVSDIGGTGSKKHSLQSRTLFVKGLVGILEKLERWTKKKPYKKPKKVLKEATPFVIAEPKIAKLPTAVIQPVVTPPANVEPPTVIQPKPRNNKSY